MSRAYRATPGFCIVRLLSAPERTAGGLHIPESARYKRPEMWGHPDDDLCWHQRGEVLALGDEQNLVEKWRDKPTATHPQGKPRERERYGHPGDMRVGDVILFGWCGEELEPGICRIKYPDCLAIDDRTPEQLATVG